ncbi:MAG: hypothetical protein AAF390_18725, partial [Pseudomonadota bacterium]
AAGDAVTETAGDAAEALEDGAQATADAVEGAVEEAGDAAQATGAAVEEAAEDAAAATDAALDEAAEETAEAAEAAGDALDEAAEETATATESLLEETEAEVTSVPVETVEAAPDLDVLLTEEGFDPDAAIVAVDESDLVDETKTELRTAIEGTRDDPKTVPGVVEQLRTAFEVE